MANKAHFFIETASVSYGQTDAFGPVSETEFRVTAKLAEIKLNKRFMFVLIFNKKA
jgi:hypothetical protein